jgi:hypothetical protein
MFIPDGPDVFLSDPGSGSGTQGSKRYFLLCLGERPEAGAGVPRPDEQGTQVPAAGQAPEAAQGGGGR